MALHTPRKLNHSPHLPFGDKQDAPFYGQDILSVKQFSRPDLEYVFNVAREMEEMVRRVGSFDLLKGKILASLFYEPSTRTSSSFTSAMERLGGSVIPISEVRYSSVSKGESLPDTVRTLEAYADVIVLRHPEMGSAELAARYARKPIINAGDGVGEHPTQALLDLFTIQEELGRIDGLTDHHGRRPEIRPHRPLAGAPADPVRCALELRFAGYPAHARTHHAPKSAATGLPQAEYTSLDPVIGKSDVLYVTRVQKERFEDPDLYESVKNAFVITPETLKAAKEEMIVMHPLPRVGEISMEVDDDPRAAYFRQMEYGLYVRMALLAMVLGKA